MKKVTNWPKKVGKWPVLRKKVGRKVAKKIGNFGRKTGKNGRKWVFLGLFYAFVAKKLMKVANRGQMANFFLYYYEKKVFIYI